MKWVRPLTVSRSIFIKFVLSFILVGLVPLIVLGYFLLDAFSTQSERYNNSNLDQMTLYMAKNVEEVFAGYNMISKLMYDDNWARELGNPVNKYSTSTIDNLLNTILGMDLYMENVYYIPSVTEDVIFQSRKAKVFDESKFPLKDMTNKLKNDPTGLVLYPTHSEAYFLGSNLQVLTLARNLLDMSTVLLEEPRVIGTLIFDVNIEVFENVFAQIALGPDDAIHMIDQEGIINYSNHKDRIGEQIKPEEKQLQSGNAIRVVTNKIPVTQQELIGQFSRKDFFSTFIQFKGVIITVLAVCMAALLLLSLTFSRKFSRPIREVITQMSKMESGNLDVNLSVKSEDELGQLTRGMNRMAKQLDYFIQDAYVAQIKQKQAELYALKTQIRPHYLYNTLEVIRMSAVMNEDMPVADMIHSLSSQLDYVLDYGENMVELSQELQNVKDYFNLIQVRYEEQVELIITIGTAVSSKWGIPKLTLQPLIENAVEHGILPKDEGGKIALEISLEDSEALLIQIIDDGVGMNESEVHELNENIQNQLSEGGAHQLGMKNVHERVQSLFGKSYGITINSIPHVGTSVQIRIPIIREVEKHDPKRNDGR
jgi:two-component system sensor histidine kinase YesM